MPRLPLLALLFLIGFSSPAQSPATRNRPTFARIKAHLDRIPSINTHEHIQPFPEIPGRVRTGRGIGINLFPVWKHSYYAGVHKLTPWADGQTFDSWWSVARDDFRNAKAASFYRYQLSAFRDLYGVDFETITPAQARELDRRIFENYFAVLALRVNPLLLAFHPGETPDPLHSP